MVVNNATKEAIDGILESCVVGSPVVNTDDFTSYGHLKENYVHHVVNHSRKEYANGDAHTNTIEGLCSLLRHYLNTFRGVCKKNLQKFVSFFEFRHNLRDLSPMDILHQLLVGIIVPATKS
ncbi:MAG: transposase [Candidatus Aenigmarchaeota archaeon]|nr:transposase [Candidatus Aenigmarchaeota archaeon]